ncbi:hypothetical protein [Bradyrhizobium sp. Bra64]|uniref:hypothetical protein n=1 Tax=Bradyrhizobium sp. Bra64 TaxID=2926009 RepID=UPI0021196F72|nr:hypothetical protein [Bradyrhizobium sp. Bra64]
MRAAICAVTFVILGLVGFVATPNLFKVVNPEYLLALHQYGRPLAALSEDASNTDIKLAELRTKISKQERSMKELSATLTAKQANMKIAGALAEDIAKVGIEAATRMVELSSELDQLNGEYGDLKDKKAFVVSNQLDIRKKLETAAADTSNIYVVARALSLGAIGALMSIIAKFLASPTKRGLLEDSNFIGRMWASMAFGGVASVVVIGLFFTGFISIFANSTQGGGETDFWKVTILCLLAGAFSDRLFQAASGRMDAYLGADQSARQKSRTSAVKAAPAGPGE